MLIKVMDLVLPYEKDVVVLMIQKKLSFYFKFFRVNKAVFIAAIIANNNNNVKKIKKKLFSRAYKFLKIILPLLVIFEKKKKLKKSKFLKNNHGEFLNFKLINKIVSIKFKKYIVKIKKKGIET